MSQVEIENPTVPTKSEFANTLHPKGEPTPEKTYLPISPRPGVTNPTRSNPRLTNDQGPKTIRPTTRSRGEGLYH